MGLHKMSLPARYSACYVESLMASKKRGAIALLPMASQHMSMTAFQRIKL